MKRHSRGSEYAALTREQTAALAEFDRAINAASGAEVPGLVVPAVLGPHYGGGLRLRGVRPRQLRALLQLHLAQERTLARDPQAARAYLDTRVDDR